MGMVITRLVSQERNGNGLMGMGGNENSTFSRAYWPRLPTSEVKRETGKPIYRFQTGNRFSKRITGYRISVTDF